MKLVSDEYLRSLIFNRLKELEWKDGDLFRDAEQRGMTIDPARWSKYKKNKSGQITDEVLIWIATRLGIDISLRYGKPVVKDNKIVWEVQKYDENECLKKLELIQKSLTNG